MTNLSEIINVDNELKSNCNVGLKRKAEDSNDFHCKKPKKFWNLKNFMDGPLRDHMQRLCVLLGIETESDNDLMKLLNKLNEKTEFKRSFEPCENIRKIYNKVNKPSVSNRESLDSIKDIFGTLSVSFITLVHKTYSIKEIEEKDPSLLYLIKEIRNLTFEGNNSAIFWITHTCGLITMQIMYEWSKIYIKKLTNYKKYDLRETSNFLRKEGLFDTEIDKLMKELRNSSAHRSEIEADISDENFQSSAEKIIKMLKNFLTKAAKKYGISDDKREDGLNIIGGDMDKVCEFHRDALRDMSESVDLRPSQICDEASSENSIDDIVDSI